MSRVFSRSASHVHRLLSSSQSPQHLHSLALQSPDNQGNNGSFASEKEKGSGETTSSAEADETESNESGQSEAESESNESGSGNEVELSWDEKVDAIESFAKSLLDVTYNLRRTSLVGKDKFSKIDAWTVFDEAVPVLETLHECLQESDKQIAKEIQKSENDDDEIEMEINDLKEDDESNFNAEICGPEPVGKNESGGFKDVMEAAALVFLIGGLSILCIIVGGSDVVLIWLLVCVIGIIYLILLKRAYLE